MHACTHEYMYVPVCVCVCVCACVCGRARMHAHIDKHTISTRTYVRNMDTYGEPNKLISSHKRMRARFMSVYVCARVVCASHAIPFAHPHSIMQYVLFAVSMHVCV
jgi:hypothetical protein